MTDVPLLAELARLAGAVLLGGLLGFEREWKERPAGLRTHAMVSLGAAAFTLLTLELAAGQEDRLRVVEGIIGGIGFLGAGTIIRRNGGIAGLTTAGSIWVAGAIGLAAGMGAWWLALAGVVFSLFVLAVIHPLEVRLRADRKECHGDDD